MKLRKEYFSFRLCKKIYFITESAARTTFECCSCRCQWKKSRQQHAQVNILAKVADYVSVDSAGSDVNGEVVVRRAG